MFAVTPSPLVGWRMISDPSEANPGDVVVEQIPDGCTDASNTVWDTTLNGGAGGLRPMNDQEITAAEQAAAVAASSFNQDKSSMANMDAAQNTRYLTQDEQRAYNRIAYRLFLRLNPSAFE